MGILAFIGPLRFRTLRSANQNLYGRAMTEVKAYNSNYVGYNRIYRENGILMVNELSCRPDEKFLLIMHSSFSGC